MLTGWRSPLARRALLAQGNWHMRLMAVLGLVSLTLAGEVQAQSAPWRAGGNEPSWSLVRTKERLILETDFGKTRVDAPVPSARRIDRRTVRLAAKVEGGGSLTVTVKDAVCRDSMSGMPHPQSVTVTHAGRRLTGCGGEPAALLRGRNWTVTRLDGAPVLPKARITMQFDDGRVSGAASCNRFSAGYRLTGEGLSFEKGLSTMMACDPDVMAQEARFLSTLEAVTRFDITGKGELALLAPDGRTVALARR